MAHLHVNTADMEADINIALPIHRFLELEAAGEIGSLAPTSYSLMGYQESSDEWRDVLGPEIAGADEGARRSTAPSSRPSDRSAVDTCPCWRVQSKRRESAPCW